jgi:hypothetical protein
MSTNVFVHDDVVDIDFTGWSRVWALSSHVQLKTADIVDARVAPRAELLEGIGWRAGGTYIPGRVVAGRYTTKGRKGVRQLWDAYTDAELLVIETRLDDPYRVVLQHPDRDFLAWIISERIHH